MRGADPESKTNSNVHSVQPEPEKYIRMYVGKGEEIKKRSFFSLYRMVYAAELL